MTDLSPEEQRRIETILNEVYGSFKARNVSRVETKRILTEQALSHAREIEELGAKTKVALAALTKAPELPRPYVEELADCDKWIKWCEDNGNDWYGINFYQGMRSGIIAGNIIEHKAKESLQSERDELKRDNDAGEGVISFLLEQNKELEAKLTSEISLTKRQHGTIGKCNVKMDELKRRVESLEAALKVAKFALDFAEMRQFDYDQLNTDFSKREVQEWRRVCINSLAEISRLTGAPKEG